MDNLVQAALQCRGAGEKVLQIARNWKCQVLLAKDINEQMQEDCYVGTYTTKMGTNAS